MTKLNLVVLRAASLDAAERFYIALGLTFTRHRHGRGPEHLAADISGVTFELYPQGASAPTAGVRVGFRVADVADVLGMLVAVGGRVLNEPAPSPWGLRAVVIDPDGHRVELTQADAPTYSGGVPTA